MTSDTEKATFHLEITRQVFVNSPTMLALCLTTVGLIKIYSTLQKITTLADDFLLFCLGAFLLATVFSYLALRSSRMKQKIAFAKFADAMFLFGLTMGTLIAVFVVYTLAG